MERKAMPSSDHERIDVAALVDAGKVSRYQVALLVLCGVCVIMDGFDVQAMGYVAPAIIAQWQADKASLGPVFGAGLLGMLVGSLTLSVLADRIGRRPVLIGASLFFAACMLATAHAATIEELLWLRFITGLGLGGIMPNAMALAGEYSPVRLRVTLMMVVSCGFTFGAAIGGLISALLIPLFGWQSVFYFGGVVPLIVAALMVPFMPESMQFLTLRGREADLDKVRRSIARIVPQARVHAATRFVTHDKAKVGMPVAQLFHEGRAVATVMLWVINFMNLLDLYFLSNWIPTLMTGAGYSTSTAVLAGTMLQVGGTIGTLAMGWIIDRIGFTRVLVPSFLLAAVTIVLVGRPEVALPLLFVFIFIAGFGIVGGQPAVNAMAATYYPTALRSTGVGWSLGIGRIGSIVGPVLGGVLVGRHVSTSTIFMLVALPAIVSAVMIVLFGRAAWAGNSTVEAQPAAH